MNKLQATLKQIGFVLFQRNQGFKLFLLLANLLMVAVPAMINFAGEGKNTDFYLLAVPLFSAIYSLFYPVALAGSLQLYVLSCLVDFKQTEQSVISNIEKTTEMGKLSFSVPLSFVLKYLVKQGRKDILFHGAMIVASALLLAFVGSKTFHGLHLLVQIGVFPVAFFTFFFALGTPLSFWISANDFLRNLISDLCRLDDQETAVNFLKEHGIGGSDAVRRTLVAKVGELTAEMDSRHIHALARS